MDWMGFGSDIAAAVLADVRDKHGRDAALEFAKGMFGACFGILVFEQKELNELQEKRLDS